MNSREEFLKSLKVENNRNSVKRYTSKTNSKEMAKTPGLYKKVAALILAGAIVGTAGCKLMESSKTELTAKQQHTIMIENLKSGIPAEIYLANKDKIDTLQKNIAEYKKLDDIFFKNDIEEKRFSELQNAIAGQDKLVEVLYLNLVKHKVAKDHGITDPSDLRIRPGYADGSPKHSVYNKADDTKILYNNLGEPVLDAITDIENFQSKRSQQAKNIPLKDTLKIRSIEDLNKYAVTDTKLMAEMVVDLNDKMMEFSREVEMDKEKSSSKKKDFGEER